jgi:hypothetical protein
MDTSLIFGLVAFSFGLYFWKKYRQREYLFSLFPIGLIILLTVFRTFSEAHLNLSADIRKLESHMLLILHIIAFLSFFVIIFMRKDKK